MTAGPAGNAGASAIDRYPRAGYLRREEQREPDQRRHIPRKLTATIGASMTCHRPAGWMAPGRRGYAQVIEARGEAPVTTGPGGERAAVGRHGHLRAAHSDREHVIDVLKAAFVEGRLTKDELATRVGQTLASRTYADLAALTADIPAWRTLARPLRTAVRPAVSSMARWGACLAIGPAVLVGAYFTKNAHLAKWLFVFVIVYYLALMVAGVAILDSRYQKRCRGQLPPGRVRQCRALGSGPDGSLGDGLTRCECPSEVRARHPQAGSLARRSHQDPALRSDRAGQRTSRPRRNQPRLSGVTCFGHISTAQLQQGMTATLKYAECMRSQG